MKLINKGIVFAGAPGTNTASCCFPGIVRLPDGKLMCSWRAGSTKESADGKIWLAHSPDNGNQWNSWPLDVSDQDGEAAGEFHYGPLTVLDDGRLLITLMWTDRSDPSLPFFNPETEGLLPVRTIFAESTDGGRTWSQRRAMDAAPYHSPMPITGPVLRLPSGWLACCFEVNKHYADTRPWRHAAAMKLSSDGGITWPEAVEVANDPSGRLMFWDQRHSIFGDRHVAMFWTYDRSANKDTNIHLSRSSGGGKTWTPPTDTGIVGQVAHPVHLRDGRLMVIYIDRFHTRSIRARLSEDDGRTFSDQVLIIHEQPRNSVDPGDTSQSADYLQDMQLWSFGRVDAVTDNTEDVWIVFYAGDSRATGIHWAHVKP